MGFDLDILRDVNFLLGFVLTLFSVVGAIILWIVRRVRAVAETVHAEGSASWSGLGQRLDAVEEDMERVVHDVRNMRAQSDALGRRLDKIEASMEQLARKDDMAILSRDFAEFRGAIGAEIKRNSGMLHTMYEAHMRASTKT